MTVRSGAFDALAAGWDLPGPAPPVGRLDGRLNGCEAEQRRYTRHGERAVSEQTSVVDALALQAEEGRGALRKAPGSR